ncbi:hypothetical protein FO519_000982 [Halicephalobus sp. NKZ332]|nr:hypothetical protein FO519_000982 [Halicephalobus sp. NKZ332]
MLTNRTSTPKQNSNTNLPESSGASISPIPHYSALPLRPRTADSGLADSQPSPVDGNEYERSQHEQIQVNQETSQRSQGNSSVASGDCADKGDACVQAFAEIAPEFVKKVERIVVQPSDDEVSVRSAPTPSVKSTSTDFTTPVNPKGRFPEEMYDRESIETTTVNDQASIATSSVIDADPLAMVESDVQDSESPLFPSHLRNMPNMSLPKLQFPFINRKARHDRRELSSLDISSFLQHVAEVNGVELSATRKNTPKIPRYNIPDLPPVQRPKDDKGPTLLSTPMLRAAPVPDETLESLAEQLRGMIMMLDLGFDLKREKMEQLEKVRDQKFKMLQKQSQDYEAGLKRDLQESEKRIVDLKAKLKLEKDKVKVFEEVPETLKKEIDMLKSRSTEQGRQILILRKNLDDAKKKNTELNAAYEEEKAKRIKYANQHEILANKLNHERELNRLRRKYEIPTMKEPEVLPQRLNESSGRTPLRQRNQAGRNQRVNTNCSCGGISTVFPSIPTPSLPIEPILPAGLQSDGDQVDQFTSNPSNKNVRWGSPIAETFGLSGLDPDEVSENNENEGASEFLKLIPADMICQKVDEDEKSMSKYYSNAHTYVRWSRRKSCRCESLVYENDDFQYRCGDGLPLKVSYFSSNKQIAILFHGIKINAYDNKQLEIHRPNDDKTIFRPDGKRFEQIYYGDVSVTEVYEQNSRKRIYPDQRIEELDMTAKRTAERSDGSFLVNENGVEKIEHPNFILARKDSDDYDGVFSLRVHYPGNEQKDLQVNCCPMHGVIVIKHVLNQDPPIKELCFCLCHEYGAGAPCLHCRNCPGLDLHYWRKVCKACGCRIDSHDIPALEHKDCDIVICSLFGHWHPSGGSNNNLSMKLIPQSTESDVLKAASRDWGTSDDSGSIVSESFLSSSSKTFTDEIDKVETKFKSFSTSVEGKEYSMKSSLRDSFRRNSEDSSKADSVSNARSMDSAWMNTGEFFPIVDSKETQTGSLFTKDWNTSEEAQRNMREFVDETKKKHFGIAKAVQCNEKDFPSNLDQNSTKVIKESTFIDRSTEESTKETTNSCRKCGCHLKCGETKIVTSHGDEVFHKDCFRCSTCETLLTDLLYFFKNGDYLCGRHFGDANFPRCGGCDELILTREYTEADGKSWHNDHFCCSKCDEPLGGRKYVHLNGRQFCFECHAVLFGEFCSTCKRIIRPDEPRLSHKEYLWHNKLDCFRCANCNTPLVARKFVFKDGKTFCSFLCKNEFRRPI